ncbi:hypothetical protein [Comamonas antarctica]|uniref:hypothetical protein n=1 Tax=Comamonas antarctica TaxID=2743470 RepID=UPI0028EFEBA8|nr:hypothetical protein [Comamonas antarctica]
MITYTKASQIAQHLTTLLEGITKANGYKTDIGNFVMRGKRKIDDTQVPCAVIIEGEDKPTSFQGPASQKITQSYVLGGYDHCDADHPNDRAHEILSDIKRAIFTVENQTRQQQLAGTHTFGGRVKAVTYRGRDIGPRADGVAIVFAVVHIDVEFVEQLTDA